MTFMSPAMVVGSALGLALAGATAWVVGCSSQSQPATPAAQSEETTDRDQDQHTGTSDEEIPAGLAGLSAADRELAIKQKVCPVSGEKLGEMGPPIKVTVAGHDVFICCPSCKEPLEQDPGKYLAKIGLEPAAM